ncbi:translation initiation factor IF-1 [Candidatus Peregrinibacteria bacterium CG10_big_fil_rev_8_21_14_0_10_49_24]|nr:MAG: translation initiation factor IF-1 [Candidatus Peregrinibacteria bacterium CG11_big_fil_rev_8_21_14_0_20_49_14]PIR50335.1 MAG: translation initiation factor IF-1 [Candidatus Peregrinibacteria bacterium CG10_big_fil_rev_8_21_14_0_10_49_24]PJA67785.1 MAG: translation initiation factor IF-1 [Candidatus Peregrinibacteria bacterium CG_4_9_14_3_um_filter_49_12]
MLRESLCRIFRLYFANGLVSKDVIELIGIVEESFPNATFRVKVLSPQAKDHELHCTLAGRMRVHRVRILPGDRVKVEMTPYDLEKGRIIYRFRSDQPLPLGEDAAHKPQEEPTEESTAS